MDRRNFVQAVIGGVGATIVFRDSSATTNVLARIEPMGEMTPYMQQQAICQMLDVSGGLEGFVSLNARAREELANHFGLRTVTG